MSQLTDHPAFRPRRFHCKWINQITQTNHGSFLVSYRSDDNEDNDQTKDCKVLTKISSIENNKIEFCFEQYFTEEEKAELHENFLRGEYDYLGDLPEF
jgi:hypothetical protein